MQFNVTTNYVQQMTIFTAAAQIAALVQLRMANRSAKNKLGNPLFQVAAQSVFASQWLAADKGLVCSQ